MSTIDEALKLIKAGASGTACSSLLTDGPWTMDKPTVTTPQYGPGASQDDVISRLAPVQGRIPDEYKQASIPELEARITAAKAALGDRLVTLGHFYQRDEVVRFADF